MDSDTLSFIKTTNNVYISVSSIAYIFETDHQVNAKLITGETLGICVLAIERASNIISKILTMPKNEVLSFPIVEEKEHIPVKSNCLGKDREIYFGYPAKSFRAEYKRLNPNRLDIEAEICENKHGDN